MDGIHGKFGMALSSWITGRLFVRLWEIEVNIDTKVVFPPHFMAISCQEIVLYIGTDISNGFQGPFHSGH